MSARSRFPLHDIGNSRFVKLHGLPRTALPADLRRLCGKSKVENVTSVAIDYRRFQPTGAAYIAFPDPSLAYSGLRSLRGSVLGGLRLKATPTAPTDKLELRRTRGAKGKAEAAERGLVEGDGPGAGVTQSGRNVLMSGLPGKMTPESLRSYLRSFKLAGMESGKDIVKLEVPRGKFAMSSTHFVRLASVSEAHRLVRKLHMSFYQRDIWGTKYQMKARVIY